MTMPRGIECSHLILNFSQYLAFALIACKNCMSACLLALAKFLETVSMLGFWSPVEEKLALDLLERPIIDSARLHFSNE